MSSPSGAGCSNGEARHDFHRTPGRTARPRELEEAARIDGAGWWSRLRHVTLPAIAPAVWLVAILTVISMFQLFAEPYVMTEGGPAQSTITVLYLMFDEGFQWWNLGIGAAVAVVLFACILAAALLPALGLRLLRIRRP